MLSLVELKKWIMENGFKLEKNKFSPGMEKRISKNIEIKKAIYYYSSFIKEDLFEPFICERILYIMNDVMVQKTCPVCNIPIKFRRDNCSKQCLGKNKIIMEQRTKTCVEKYGVTNPSYAEVTKNKISKKNREHATSALEKRKATNNERYGKEFLLQDEKYISKAKQTNIKKFGVDNIFKSKQFIEENKIRKSNRSEEEKRLLYLKAKPKWFKTALTNGLIFNYTHATPLFSENDWNQNKHERKFKCTTCGNTFTIHSNSINRCTHCFPIDNSKAEIEILNFLKSVYDKEIKHTDRMTIKPLELDFYLPEANLAIEYDGLLYHSYGKHNSGYLNNFEKENPKYHLHKSNLCKSQNIQLIHIFENEWIDPIKQNIWKSIIKSKLGVLNNKIYARKCRVKEVSVEDAKLFLEENHLQGNSSAKIKLGLYNDNELICLITFSKPRYNKQYDWELVRFCTKVGFSVIGGFSKLLTYFRRQYNGSIITYADKRYSEGELYRNNNFNELKDSTPNYFYWKYRSLVLFSRLKFQKHKLKNILEHFDNEKTEFENMMENGYRRLWDCGNKVFELV